MKSSAENICPGTAEKRALKTEGNAERAVVVIPCSNEERRLKTREFAEFSALHPDISIIFVNDGSTDGTSRILAEICAAGPLRALELDRNVGKAEAVRRGMLEALKSGGVCGFWDADLSTSLDELPGMLEALRRGNFRCVVGSRWLHLGDCRIKRRFFRHFIGRIFATCVSLKLDLPVYDTQCGAKLFTPEAAAAAFASPFVTRWFFDVEILMRLQRFYGTATPPVLEHPVSWIDSPGSKVSYCRALVDFLKLMVLK